MGRARPPSHRHATVVVDMTCTRFCDSSGFSVLVGAHKRALADGGGLRLVISADSQVFRIFTVIDLGRFIPCRRCRLSELRSPALSMIVRQSVER